MSSPTYLLPSLTVKQCADDMVCVANIDKELEKFMRLYFRKETDEKQRSNEIERGKELFGEEYRHSSCTVM